MIALDTNVLVRYLVRDGWRGFFRSRSRTAFAKVGFRVVAHIALPPGGKARSTCEMRIARTEWAAGANPLA